MADDRSVALLAELSKRGIATKASEDTDPALLTDDQLIAEAKKLNLVEETSVAEAKDRQHLKMLQQTEERKLFPILGKVAVTKEFVARAAATPDAEQRANIVSRAKVHKLTPVDVMTVVVAAYGDATTQKVLAQLVLEYPDPVERVREYNLWVASLWGDAFLKRHGDKILALTYPLYPPGEQEFSELNVDLLGAVKASVAGGSAPVFKVDDAEAEKLFSKPKGVMLRTAQSRTEATASLKALGGVVPAAVVSDGQGGYCVDLAPVASAFTSMVSRQDESDRHIARLQDELRQLKAKSGTPAEAFADRGNRGRGGRGGGGGNRGNGRGGGGGGGRGGVFGAGAAATPDDVGAAIAGSGFP